MFIGSLLACLAIQSEQTMIYHEKTGDQTLKTVWTVKREKNELDIEAQNKNKTKIISASVPYKTISFKMVSHKNSNRYLFERKGSKLEASGKLQGKELSHTYDIGEKNWVQEFELGLGPFLKSSSKTFKFVILNPKNFKLHPMVATKLGEDEVTIDGKTHKSEKIKVTLQGLKSIFWKAQIWYNPETHDMLLYKANQGPHTPTTVISINSTAGDPNLWYHTLWDRMTKSDKSDKEDSK